jgi:hypothetical protein
MTFKMTSQNNRLTRSSNGLRGLKEHAPAEGVSTKLVVALGSAIRLSHGNKVSEMAEYHEKVPRTSTRPHVDLVPGRNGTGTRLMRADT